MKKLLVLVLLVPILALTMISCDADMRSNIAGFMGGLGGNVYADAGLIVVNTAQAEAAATTVAAIGTGAGAEDADTDSFGVTISAPAPGTKVLVPQSPAKQKELKDNLGEAFNSDIQKKKLLEDLKKPVLAGSDQQKAAKGTVEVFNATLDALETSLAGSGTDLGDTLKKLKLPAIDTLEDLTQGDLLALQLMTDLISNTAKALKEIGDIDDGDGSGAGTGLTGLTGDKLEANKAKVLSIIDDALFTAEMAEQLSGAASIDFTGQIDLGSLLDGLNNRGTESRKIPLDDAEEFIDTINALSPSIVNLMGVTFDGTNFVYSDPKYRSFLLNQQIYRSSIEQAMKLKELGKLEEKDIKSLTFDTSTLIKYGLAVFITEYDAFWQVMYIGEDDTPSSIIVAYLNANKKLGLGTLTKDDDLVEPDSAVTGLDYDDWPAFIKASDRRKGTDEGKTYFTNILKTFMAINDLGGIARINTEIQDFLDDASDDGFDKTYDELME